MIDFPNAKINLGLQITEKRIDGYHNIISLFCPITCTDVLEVLPSDELHFTQSGAAIPSDGKDNLCLRAYQLLKKDFDIAPVAIHLHKILPVGAGLGGGSADAAFTLKMLNGLFKLDLTAATLEGYARQLGSDCAFFIQNRPRLAVEKGDVFEEVNIDLKDYHITLVFPAIHISSGEAYSGVKPQKPLYSIKEIITQPISDWKTMLHNDFEASIFPKYPELAHTKEHLYKKGAIYAAMTGSGSAIFGIFEQAIDLNTLELPPNYWTWQGTFL